jgi:formylglycine-generating enzyme required for sulfatase activity
MAELNPQSVKDYPEARIEIAAPIISNLHGRWFLPGAGKAEWLQDLAAGPEMVVVPPGKFLMGSPGNEPERFEMESPQVEVIIPSRFAVARCAVTRGEFAAFIEATGYDAGTDWCASPQDDSHPVDSVSWHDAQAYVHWLSAAAAASYRLPSEAEWEYTCRAGSGTPFWWGTSITPGRANYNGCKPPYKGGGHKGASIVDKRFPP